MSIKQQIINYALRKTIGDLPMDTVRRRLYDNVYPLEYGDIVGAYNRFKKAVKDNKQDKIIEHNGYNSYRDDIWAEYLGIPNNERHHSDLFDHKVYNSKYKPTNGNENVIYKKIGQSALYNKNSYGISLADMLVFEANDIESKKLNIGENKLSKALSSYFGKHTIGRGLDPKKGEYISYYDLWDLAPIGKQGEDQSNGIGTPIHFYDRIYLDDYYGVPKNKRKPSLEDGFYGGYLPELIVNSKRN